MRIETWAQAEGFGLRFCKAVASSVVATGTCKKVTSIMEEFKHPTVLYSWLGYLGLGKKLRVLYSYPHLSRAQYIIIMSYEWERVDALHYNFFGGGAGAWLSRG